MENCLGLFILLLFVLQSTPLPTESLISSDNVECSECGNSTLICMSGHWSSVDCSKCLCTCEVDSQCSENEYCGAQGFSESGIPKGYACMYAPKGVEDIKITPEMAMQRNIEEGLAPNDASIDDYLTGFKPPTEDEDKKETFNEDDNCVPNCQVDSLCGFPCDNFPDAKCIPDNCSCSSKFDLNGAEPLCYGDPDSVVDLEEAPDNFEDWFPMGPDYKPEYPEVDTTTSTLATTTIILTTTTTKPSLATETSTLTTTQQQDVTTATTDYSTATTVATPTSFLLQMVLLPVVLLLVAMTTVLVVRKIYQNMNSNKKSTNVDRSKPNEQELESLKPLKTEEV